MPSRAETARLARELFESSHLPGGLSKDSAWLGLYQVLLWYEPAKCEERNSLPHIIDADKIRRPGAAGPTAWQSRAIRVEESVADALSCAPEQLKRRVDRLMRRPEFRGMQRHNTLGIAFPALVAHVLERLGSSHITLHPEVRSTELFPGVAHLGRSPKGRIDLLAKSASTGLPAAVLSTKWSLRHDRINDMLSECLVYKYSAQAAKTQLRYYSITNEFDPARLNKLLTDQCVDGVVHMRKDLLTAVCDLDGRLDRLLDLSDLIRLTASW